MKHELPILYKRTSKGGTQVWQIKVEKTPEGYGVLVVTHGLQDGKKQTTRDVVREGKNLGKKNATTPYEQAVAEAQSQWEIKKSRKGYGLTVEASASVRAASPMLAHKYPDHHKKVDWSTGFAQPKLDGFRCLARITADRDVILLSRENQPLNALDDIAAAIRFIAGGTHVSGTDATEIVLDGEMYCHGMSLNEISSACKKQSDLTDRIEFHVYDAMLGSADFATRYRLAQDFVRVAAHDRLRIVETVKVRSEAELMKCQAEFLADGYEGAMLRYGTVGYEAGKRSDKLLKVKTFQDDEFEVVDFKMGRGKHEGIPDFVCKTEAGHEFTATAPGTLAEKRALGAKAAEMVGKMLTVKYIYFTKTSKPVPFLPVAVSFRDLYNAKMQGV